MSRVCSAPGCSSPAASRFSLYCKAHKARLRRHGAVDQVGVTEALLGSYKRLVRVRIEKNKESPLWGQLEARWDTIVSHAQSIVDGHQRG